MLEYLGQNHLCFSLNSLLLEILINNYGSSHFEVVPFIQFQQLLFINHFLILLLLFLQLTYIELVRFVSCASFEFHLFSLIEKDVLGQLLVAPDVILVLHASSVAEEGSVFA